MQDKLHPPKIKWLVEPQFDDEGNQLSSGLSAAGEHPDPIPMEPPIGLSVTQADPLRALFSKEREAALAFARAVEAEQFESEADANDFDVPEDIFPPGNEPWADVHDFLAAEREAARAGQLASASSSGGTAAQTAAPQAVSQTASVGSGVAPSATSSAERPSVSGTPGKASQ